MIDIRELRVNNLVNVRRGSLRPHAICIGDFCGGQDKFDKFEPIPIDKELLQKNGFNFVPNTLFSERLVFDTFYNLVFDISLTKDYLGNNFQYESGIEIRYVHQLQNLVYVLTGKELEVEL